MEKYKVRCSKSYSIFGQKMPDLDQNATYYIVDKSRYYPSCVIIQRTDKKDFLGNHTWIVPESEIERI